MSFSFSSIKPSEDNQSEIDPIKLFRSLKVKDSSINDLWLAQADALKPWHASRDEKDTLIGLNTGAGKTLIGLLIAQSLVNETRGKILYICSSIQLVEQTRQKGEGYGIETTTYFGGKYSNNLYSEGKAVCLTTYQALFNGKSKFRNEQIEAIIFDDAHTAESVLRSQFSLDIKQSDFLETYKNLAATFHEYFKNAGKIETYNDVIESSNSSILLVPPSVIRKKFSVIQDILRNADLNQDKNTMFAWEHLKDHIDLCCFLISRGSICITPPFIPTRSLPYFSQDVRRVYLSATMDHTDAFTKGFGRKPSKVISPESPAGECERLILAPQMRDEVKDEILLTKELINHRKTLILTTTYRKAERWDPEISPPERSEVSAAVTSFKESKESVKLLLTARYDGVDLPGDTCRVMVIDSLPSATSPLERFMWEFLRMSNTLRSTIASRIVQSFGRISRGMSDYGIVILCGEDLINWLLTPMNKASLPIFLQKQLALGFEISKSLPAADMNANLDKCLDRSDEWTKAYEEFITNCPYELITRLTEKETELALSESKYSKAMWDRDYSTAIRHITKTIETAREISSSTYAWHLFWLASATELNGDSESARELYARAYSHQNNLPRPDLTDLAVSEKESNQETNILFQFDRKQDGLLSSPKKMRESIAALDIDSSPNQVEEAIHQLGILLGFTSSRPDKEHGTGPDNLWISENTALCIDAKSDKTTSSTYNKKSDIGQMADHVEWVKNNTDTTSIITIFAGPLIKSSHESNPPSDLLVITTDNLFKLGTLICDLYSDLASTSSNKNLRQDIKTELTSRELNLNNILQTAGAQHLVDIH